MDLRLDGRVAIVTGAGQGIGAGIAQAYLQAGARVVVVDMLRQEHAQWDAVPLKTLAERGAYLVADVSDEQQVQQMVDTTIERFGRIDILVNNAGVISQAPVVDLTVAEWDRIMATNLRSVFLCCHTVLPHMLAQGSGRIINIASQLAYLGGAGTAHYSASKGGVVSFTRSLAREVAGQGILVNGIAPGPIETPLQVQTPPEWRAWKTSQLPLGRFGLIQEVAPTAVFLASDASTYYVGQILGPNGGDVMP
ncbi:MAG TPA: glucose 1-dehydrogenase [Chloroflexota bacterium]|nr:glucose 1-dehydrogenase [Chloroflexota bacterium]